MPRGWGKYSILNLQEVERVIGYLLWQVGYTINQQKEKELVEKVDTVRKPWITTF